MLLLTQWIYFAEAHSGEITPERFTLSFASLASPVPVSLPKPWWESASTLAASSKTTATATPLPRLFFRSCLSVDPSALPHQLPLSLAHSGPQPQLTLARCGRFCAALALPWAGVHAGNACVCGAAPGPDPAFSTAIAPSACDAPCAGDPRPRLRSPNNDNTDANDAVNGEDDIELYGDTDDDSLFPNENTDAETYHFVTEATDNGHHPSLFTSLLNAFADLSTSWSTRPNFDSWAAAKGAQSPVRARPLRRRRCGQPDAIAVYYMPAVAATAAAVEAEAEAGAVAAAAEAAVSSYGPAAAASAVNAAVSANLAAAEARKISAMRLFGASNTNKNKDDVRRDPQGMAAKVMVPKNVIDTVAWSRDGLWRQELGAAHGHGHDHGHGHGHGHDHDAPGHDEDDHEHSSAHSHSEPGHGGSEGENGAHSHRSRGHNNESQPPLSDPDSSADSSAGAGGGAAATVSAHGHSVSVTVAPDAPLLCAAVAFEGGALTGSLPPDASAFQGSSAAEAATVLAAAAKAADCFAIDVYEYVLNTSHLQYYISLNYN